MKEIIGAAIFKNGKVLLVQDGEEWDLPGGIKEKDESYLEFLARRINNQLEGTKIESASFYKRFDYDKSQITVRIYRVRVRGEVRKSAETITQWVRDYKHIPLKPITKNVLDRLKADGYI